MTVIKKVMGSQSINEVVSLEKQEEMLQLKHFVKKRIKGLHLSVMQVVCFFFSRHKKQMLAGIETVEAHLEVSFLLRKLLEID